MLFPKTIEITSYFSKNERLGMSSRVRNELICHFAKKIFKTRFWSARSFTNWCCCLTILSTVGDHVSIIRGRESSTVDKMVSIVQMYIVVHTTSEFSSISSTRRRITTTGFFLLSFCFVDFWYYTYLKKVKMYVVPEPEFRRVRYKSDLIS